MASLLVGVKTAGCCKRVLLWIYFAIFLAQPVLAQELIPRAYVITPIRLNAVILGYSFYSGSILLNGALPITNSSGRVSLPLFSYYRSLGFFGRSANLTVSLPYGVAHFQGTVDTVETTAYRSGLLDSYYRFSVNLKGGPAMSREEFGKWRQKTLIGTSIEVVAPTGQYDAAKLINYGAHRWAVKPEVGVSHRKGRYLLDVYGAVWFFTENQNYLSGHTLTQKPIGAFEGHLSYDVTPRLWVSADGNFWFGGQTSVNGQEAGSTLQSNSRAGATSQLRLTQHQSVKVSYSRGTYIRYGGNFQNISVAWQYSWIDGPRSRHR